MAITGGNDQVNLNKAENCINFESNHTFTNAFLFSLELQSTIGFGSRHPKDRRECWPIIFFQCIQPMLALIIEGFLVVAVYTKLTDARFRKFRKFLPKCCIYKRDGKLTLTFRSKDLKVSELCSISANCKILISSETFEGEKLTLQEREIRFDSIVCAEFFCTKMPVDLTHTIDDSSPLYDLGQGTFNQKDEQLELIVSMSATVMSTGSLYQTTKSYTTDDILWGYRFKQCIFLEEDGYVVNEELIDKTIKVEMGPESQEILDKNEADRILNKNK